MQPLCMAASMACTCIVQHFPHCLRVLELIEISMSFEIRYAFDLNCAASLSSLFRFENCSNSLIFNLGNDETVLRLHDSVSRLTHACTTLPMATQTVSRERMQGSWLKRCACTNLRGIAAAAAAARRDRKSTRLNSSHT